MSGGGGGGASVWRLSDIYLSLFLVLFPSTWAGLGSGLWTLDSGLWIGLGRVGQLLFSSTKERRRTCGLCGRCCVSFRLVSRSVAHSSLGSRRRTGDGLGVSARVVCAQPHLTSPPPCPSAFLSVSGACLNLKPSPPLARLFASLNMFPPPPILSRSCYLSCSALSSRLSTLALACVGLSR